MYIRLSDVGAHAMVCLQCVGEIGILFFGGAVELVVPMCSDTVMLMNDLYQKFYVIH